MVKYMKHYDRQTIRASNEEAEYEECDFAGICRSPTCDLYVYRNYEDCPKYRRISKVIIDAKRVAGELERKIDEVRGKDAKD